MRQLLCLVLLTLSMHAWSVELTPSDIRIAKINLSELNDDLRDVILAKVENAALKKEVEAAEAADEVRSQAMQAASQAGKNIQEVLKDLPGSDGKAGQRLDRLMKAEVLKFIVKKYGKRYVAVLDADYGDTVLYLDGEIVDLTQTIRQALQLNEF